VNKSLLETTDKSSTRRIPLQSPFITDEDRGSVFEAISSDQIAGSGPVCQQVEAEISRMTGSRYVFLTTSCTHALELAALSLDLKADDEVILPSFTFTSTANAFLLRDARLIFADINPATFNLDPEDVRKRITPRTKAIVLVHYAGMPCDMDAFREIARTHGIALVEDAAQAVDARYKGRHLGTIGDIGCFSFHSTKNITCGEGGAFLSVGNDAGPSIGSSSSAASGISAAFFATGAGSFGIALTSVDGARWYAAARASDAGEAGTTSRSATCIARADCQRRGFSSASALSTTAMSGRGSSLNATDESDRA